MIYSWQCGCFWKRFNKKITNHQIPQFLCHRLYYISESSSILQRQTFTDSSEYYSSYRITVHNTLPVDVIGTLLPMGKEGRVGGGGGAKRGGPLPLVLFTHGLLGRVVPVVAGHARRSRVLPGRLHALRYLLEAVLPHLDPLRHVADRGVLCNGDVSLVTGRLCLGKDLPESCLHVCSGISGGW